MPVVTIDGIKVEVETDTTILAAARKAGVWIPTLCCHPAMPPGGTCRICMVELDRGDWKQLVTSCNYPVRRDITVSVSSERAVRARRGTMQLLLARAPESEELQALARRMGVAGTPHPTVTETQHNCILCGLCTQVCEEVIGQAGIGFAGRGTERVVAAPFLQPPVDCIACGACAAVCPVGTIQLRIHEDAGEVEISPFNARVKMLSCEECGALIVPQPVATKVLEQFDGDWEEFRRRAKLCPECRRKQTAEALALGTNVTA